MSFSFSLHNSASSCLLVSCKKDGRMCHVFFANYPVNPGAVVKRTVLYFFFVNDLDNFLNIFCFVFSVPLFCSRCFCFYSSSLFEKVKIDDILS